MDFEMGAYALLSGLKNAGHTFFRTMEYILRLVTEPTSVTLVDDLSPFSARF